MYICSEIIRMLNTAFDDFIAPNSPARALDLYPLHLQPDIDAINSWIYNDINNGVYKCGFAGTQESYDNHVTALFQALDRVEIILSEPGRHWLVGDGQGKLTEADIRLFTTIVR